MTHILTRVPLIKFHCCDIIRSFQKGCMYMNTLEYFRKRENQVGDIVVGDGAEALLPIREAQLVLYETGEIKELKNEYIQTKHSNDYVFCMFSLREEQASFSFSEDQKKELASFGDMALVILDSYEFITRVQDAAKREGLQLTHRYVEYYDEADPNPHVHLSTLYGMQNLAFWKRKQYAAQQEYRFVASMTSPEIDHIELQIGDISDISRVLKTQEVLSARIEAVGLNTGRANSM